MEVEGGTYDNIHALKVLESLEQWLWQDPHMHTCRIRCTYCVPHSHTC